MSLNAWTNVLQGSFENVANGVVGFVPNLVIALVVILVGWLIAAALAKVVSQIIRSVKLDTALTSAGLDKVVSKSGHTLNSGRFLGELVRWFTIVVFFMAAFEVLGLTQVNNFLQDVVVNYIPQVIAAVLILFVGVIVADFLRKTVLASSRAAGMVNSNFLASVTKWSIWIVAALAALFQLGIGATFIQTLFTGLVVALALAFGLSFGLGGKEAAARYIEKLRMEISDRN